MKTRKWEDLTNNEKLDRLSSVLTLAGADVKFRERCLVSPESAKTAVSELADVEFPSDFHVQFMTPEERLKTLILAMPDLIPTEDQTPEPRNAEDFVPCSYNSWRT